MTVNPYQSPETEDALGAEPSRATRLERFRRRMKSCFRVAAVFFGLLTVAGAINGGYHVWLDLQHGGANPLSLSMLFGALVTGLCAGMLFWISKRL